MKQYIDLCKLILEKGTYKEDRTNTGTISYFGVQMRFNLAEGFPLLTTKKMFYRGIIHELLWFIHGDTNLKYLVDNKVNIWNEWGFERYKKHADYQNETMAQYIEKIRESAAFAEKYGDLGPIYGKQWRNFNGIDQLQQVIAQIKTNPDSRRHIISSWNPQEIEQMALPPCHLLMQFYVVDGKLSCQLYQRSGDVFLGVPFNIASYALLTHLIADVCQLEVGEFVHTIGDAHIYSNHLAQIKLQIERETLPLAQLVLHGQHHDITDFTFTDIEIVNYQSHAKITGAIAV